MGPFSLKRQLERKASVFQLLQRDDLSEWARNYWSEVFDAIATDEGRYNARVVGTWKSIQKNITKEWL